MNEPCGVHTEAPGERIDAAFERIATEAIDPRLVRAFETLYAARRPLPEITAAVVATCAKIDGVVAQVADIAADVKRVTGWIASFFPEVK